VIITTNRPDTKPNPKFLTLYPNPTTKQHSVVSIQLDIVAYHTYPEKLTGDNVIAPFTLLSVVTVTV